MELRRGEERMRSPTQSLSAKIIEERIVKYNGDIAVKKYLRQGYLGKGGFAQCYEFKNLESGHISAAKVIQKANLKKSRAKQKLMSEIKIHRSVKHESIVGFQHFFQDQDNVYILLQLCPNQSLNDLVKRRKRLTEVETICYMNQIVGGLKYLHKNRIIHRDMKLGNLFLGPRMEVKIGDFGLAAKLEFQGQRKRTICGTPNYIAPEVLEGRKGHSYEVDIWSLGVVLYTMLVGKPPFETDHVKKTYELIKKNQYFFPESHKIPQSGKALITSLLQSDPTRRLDLEEVATHPFLNPTFPVPPLMPASSLTVAPSFPFRKMSSSEPYSPHSPHLKRESRYATDQQISARAHPAISPTARGMASTASGPFFSRNPGFQEPQAGEAKTKMMNDDGEVVMASPGVCDELSGPEVWVLKWVDYSSKYGLGYLLSNGATGVFFNDATKITLEPLCSRFCYIQRKQVEGRAENKQDTPHFWNLQEYPNELQKKVTLLQHFRGYLDGSAEGEIGVCTSNSPKINIVPKVKRTLTKEQRREGLLIYVKKWMKTKHAILFRLSNRVIQVRFLDKTEILLDSKKNVVTYVNKQAQRLLFPLNLALESRNAEMARRLKYSKDLLTQMVQIQNGLRAGTGSSPKQSPRN